ncbi:MAG: RNA polymerase factor sigma-32 [Myxococcales bacterium]|nr:RNA polymerase factor sigma-32 [Myxococcales bacterium]
MSDRRPKKRAEEEPVVEVIDAEADEGEEQLGDDEEVIEAELVEHASSSDADGDGELDDGDADATLPVDDDEESDGSPSASSHARSTSLVPRGGSLAVRDPLQAYINEARRYPLLSREEEHALAVKYVEEGDLDAARRLVTANLRLVVKIAHEYRKAYRNLLDLVQEGNVGLMHAVKKFDPYRGVKLSSYAAWWIRAYILKFILNNWRLVKIGTTQSQRKLFFNLRKEVEKLRQLGIDNPQPKMIAERLDVPEHEVVTMQKRLAARDLSLDAPLRAGEDTTSTRLDFVTTDEQAPDEAVANEQFSERVQRVIREFGATLSGRDKEIFELRTVAEEPLTLQELGDKYGITRERARQLERRMMDRLRDHLREQLGDAVDVHLGIAD